MNTFVEHTVKYTAKYIAVLVLFGLLGALSSVAESEEPAAGPFRTDSIRIALQPMLIAQVTEPLDQRAYDDYVNGLLLEGFGDLSGASQSYSNALGRYPQSATLAHAYASVLLRLQKPLLALNTLKDIKEPDVDVCDLRAQCYRMLGDEYSAKNEYLKVTALDSTSFTAFAFLAAYYERRSIADSTIWAFEHLDQINPGNPQILEKLGLHYYAAGKTDLAKGAFSRSIEADPSIYTSEAVMSLAEIYRVESKADSAADVIEKALVRNGDQDEMHRYLVGLYFGEDQYARALPHLNALVRSKPDNLEIRRHLATLYMALDSLDQARGILERITETPGAAYEDYYALGQIDVQSERWTEAAANFRMAAQKESWNPGAWQAMSFCYRRLGKPQQEIATLEQGIDKMRDQETAVQLYFTLGSAYEQNNQVDSAVSVFERLLEHDPDNHLVLNYLGYTLADRGVRLDYAQELVERALKLQPDNAAYLDSYGWVEYRQGNFDEAVKYLARAAALDNNPEILDHLGEAYWSNGNRKEARKVWKQVLQIQPDNKSIQEKLKR